MVDPSIVDAVRKLDGLRVGSHPETRAALRSIMDALPFTDARAFSIGELLDTVFEIFECDGTDGFWRIRDDFRHSSSPAAER
jgi:hypothetical protein